MIKKYFIDSTESNEVKYGTGAINKIVDYLRTTGIFGEIVNCLKITAGSGTTLNIADGIGWVDGCGIEASSGETLILPTANGTYSVIIKLNKVGDTVNDIAFAYESGQTVGLQVLAWVTVYGSAITNVVDKRTNSTFRGITQIITGTAPWQAGDNIILSDSESTTTSAYATYIELKKYRVRNSGTVKVSFVLGENVYADGAYARIYVNDVAIGTERHIITTTNETFNENITIVQGDKISIYAKLDGYHPSAHVSISKVTFGINRGSDIIVKE